MRFSRFILTLVCTSLLVMILSIPVVSARFYLNPVDSSSSWIEMPVVPGTLVSADFVLVNGGEELTTYDLDVVDAASTDEEDGFFSLEPNGSEQFGIGLWGSLSSDRVALKTGERETLTVTFLVPEETEFGHYWGGVTAMVVEAETAQGEGASVKVEVRNGVRAHLEVMSSDDYEAWLAAQNVDDEEEVVEESSLNLMVWMNVGILVLILAILLAYLKIRGAKKKKF